MRNRRWVAVAVAGVAIAGCGNLGGSDPGGNEPGNRATCIGRTLTLVGDLDGKTVDVEANTTSALLQQSSQPYTLDVSYDGGVLHMEWSAMVSINGRAASATGTLVMPGGPHVGDTLCAGSGTIRETSRASDPFRTDYPLTLRMLEVCPNITGVTLTGGIDACVGN